RERFLAVARKAFEGTAITMHSTSRTALARSGWNWISLGKATPGSNSFTWHSAMRCKCSGRWPQRATVWPFSEMILANALPQAPAPSTETFMAAPPVDARSRPDPVSPDQIGIHRAAWSRSGVRCRAGAAGYSNDAYRWRAQ